MQVLQQWMRVARSSPAAAAVMEEEEEETFPRPYSPTTIVDDDYSEDYVPPQPKAKVKAKPREKKPPPAKKVTTATAVKVINWFKPFLDSVYIFALYSLFLALLSIFIYPYLFIFSLVS